MDDHQSMDERDSPSPASSNRRRLLMAVGAAALAGSAGCIGDTGRTDRQLRNEVANLESQLASTEANLADAENENRALQDEVERLEDRVTELEEQLSMWNIWGIAESDLETLQTLATTWMDSIVTIDVITDDGRWSVGTGWAYESGVIATNAHVVQPRRLPDETGITEYAVWTHEGTRYDGELIGYTFGEDDIFDNREDIAFLAVPDGVTDQRVMERGVSRDLESDEPLLQIGHPWSVNYWTPAVGPFVAHREPFYVSNIPGQPGVSGSPVLDLNGEVIGMTWGGQYHQVPQRSIGDPPRPGPESILTTFEESVNGIHSYINRIDSAFAALA